MDKPRRGTPDHTEWLTATMRECAAHYGVSVDVLKKSALIAWARARGQQIGARDWHGYRLPDGPSAAYSLLRAMAAQGALGPFEVDISDLDWDEDPDTDEVPLPPIPSGHYVKGVSTYVDDDGRTKGQWIKTARVDESREETLARLLTELPPSIPVRADSIAPPEACDDDLLAVYPMGDPHIGMMSWAPETGHDFDLKIAERLICGAIDALTQQTPRAAHALVLNCGDFYHSDNAQNRTGRSGNALDVDGRFAKIQQVGMRIMVHVIDAALRAHESVTVENLIGNHDDHTSIMLSVALDAYYRNEPRVHVSLSPALHRYHRFGKCLIGMAHGDKIKMNELQKIMSVDRREDWGGCTDAYWYLGHVHHTRRVEDYGCTIETFRTLAPGDSWHTGQGYRSNRDMNRIVLHREYGELSRSLVGASYLERQYRAQVAA